MMWGKEQFISHANRSFYAAGSGQSWLIYGVSHIVMMWGKEQFISHANRSFYAAGSGKAGWYIVFHT